MEFAYATSALALERVSIVDKDAFEKQYIECISSGIRNNCIVPLFRDHDASAGYDAFKQAEESANKLNTLFHQLLKETYVYKVHIISKKTKAEVYDDREYLIQWGTGKVTCFRVLFREIKGKWYVANFQLINDSEYITKILDLKW
jgi:hypothetical protein